MLVMFQKRINKYVSFIVGLIWFILVAVGLYYYYTMFMGIAIDDIPAWLGDKILIVVVIIAVVFFTVFDRFVIVVRRVINYYLKRFIK